MNKWQQQVYDMLRVASRNRLSCTIPADLTHIPANMMLEADKTKWISVKDRLPEDGEIVICKDLHFFDVLQWSSTNETWFGAHAIHGKDYVTHWMPLPESPEEDGKDEC